MTGSTTLHDQTEQEAERKIYGEIVAENVSADDFMTRYAGEHHEWVRGVVVKMSPIDLRNYEIITYLLLLLRTYFTMNPIGRVVGEPFVMRLDSVPSRREPDLQVILHTNPGKLTDTAMIGAADICIEVVSPESVARDYGEKMVEYEQGGVGEYWLIDPRRRAAIFYRLTERAEEGRLYQAGALDDGDCYTTPLLPRFALPVPTLWSDPLPDILAVVESMRAALAD